MTLGGFSILFDTIFMAYGDIFITHRDIFVTRITIFMILGA